MAVQLYHELYMNSIVGCALYVNSIVGCALYAMGWTLNGWRAPKHPT